MVDKEFERYARSEFGVSPMTVHRYSSVYDAYINPTIIEERRLNVASMDVFSRLMMDRIIFLGVPIDDDVANIVQAQLLFLAFQQAGLGLLVVLLPGLCLCHRAVDPDALIERLFDGPERIQGKLRRENAFRLFTDPGTPGSDTPRRMSAPPRLP